MNLINNTDNIKIMDRIYTIFDSDVLLMKSWAFQNGYIPKWEQNSKTHQIFDVNGTPSILLCKLGLKKFEYKYYPYLDTLPYIDMSQGIIHNIEFGYPWDYKLVQADGSLFRVDESEEMLAIDDDD